MAIPDYQSLMLPILRFLGDKKEHSFRDTLDALAKEFNLSERELKKFTPSGKQRIFDNRLGWARTYMKKAGLLESTRRGILRITDRGVNILRRMPRQINNKYLRQFPEFLEFRKR